MQPDNVWSDISETMVVAPMRIMWLKLDLRSRMLIRRRQRPACPDQGAEELVRFDLISSVSRTLCLSLPSQIAGPGREES